MQLSPLKAFLLNTNIRIKTHNIESENKKASQSCCTGVDRPAVVPAVLPSGTSRGYRHAYRTHTQSTVTVIGMLCVCVCWLNLNSGGNAWRLLL